MSLKLYTPAFFISDMIQFFPAILDVLGLTTWYNETIPGLG